MERITLTAHQRARVVVHGIVSDASVRRWEAGKKLRETTSMRIERAIVELSLAPQARGEA